jgi:hypothetical protein
LVQEAGRGVGWVKLPDDLKLALGLNTDDTVRITLGHRDPGESFLTELRALANTASIDKEHTETKIEVSTY